MNWSELRKLEFTPIPQTRADDHAGLYRYSGPDGMVVTLSTGKVHADECVYVGAERWRCVPGCRR
jgi:hypothetical protein